MYLVSFFSLAWVLSDFENGFSLSFPFLDSHGVMGLFLGWALDCLKVLDPSMVVSRKSQGLGVEMVFSRKLSTGGWRRENSSRDGEGIMRHPSSIWFFDIRTSFSEMMYSEGGGGLTFGLPWLFMDWFIP